MGLCSSVSKNSNSRVNMTIIPSLAADKNLIPPPTPVKLKPDCAVDPPVNSIGFKSQVSPLNQGSLNRAIGSSYRSYAGSNEESFFESHTWLDSDCDDDFYSVSGDSFHSTPSRGSTPVHRSMAGTPKCNKAFPLQSNEAIAFSKPLPLKTDAVPPHNIEPQITSGDAPKPEAEESNAESTMPSPRTPTDKKRKLLDLFRESRPEVDLKDLSSSSRLGAIDANGALERKPSNIPESSNGTPHLSGANSISSNGKTPVTDSVMPVKEKPYKYPLPCIPRLMRSISFGEKKKSSSSRIPAEA